MRSSSRLLRAVLVGVLAAAAALAVQAAGVLDRVEDGLVDTRFDLRGEQEVPEGVVVVGIDEETFERLQLQWPFPRRLHARAIRELQRAGARAIAYDVEFSEPSESPADDRALLRAARAPGVVLGTTSTAADGRPAVIGGRGALANLPTDADGVFRSFEARIEGVPVLSAAVTGRAWEGKRPIAFAGPPGTVEQISFADVVEGRLDPRDVRDRIVVVGATDPALQDYHRTAVGGRMAGAEVHASAIATVLDDFPLQRASPAAGVLLVVAAALLAPLASLPGSPAAAVWRALGAGLLGAAALLAGAYLAFLAGLILPVATPVLALALGTAGTVGTTYATEIVARRRVRRAFERFVPREVVGELLHRGDGSLRLEPRRMQATVLFCDLRGFTTLAEGLDAERVIQVLNRYLGEVTAAVLDHGGTVVSFQGDGVLAVFGAPLERPDHAARALAAAREIRDVRLPAFNAWLAARGIAAEPMRVGIGLNTGPVMSGSVGSERRLEYAAVGDATNVAARLQALSRDLPGSLVTADSTVAALASGDQGLRRHGPVTLKGRQEPVDVYLDEG